MVKKLSVYLLEDTDYCNPKSKIYFMPYEGGIAKLVGFVTYEQKIGFRITLFPVPYGAFFWSFNYDEFLKILFEAKDLLILYFERKRFTQLLSQIIEL